MLSHSFLAYCAIALFSPIVGAKPQAPLAQGGSSGSVSGAAAANAEPTSPAGGCGACALVADVAGLVWYSEIFLNEQTAVVGVGMNNASRTTRTSLVQPEGALTYLPGGGGATGLTQVNYEPSITISGAVLTSPTAYNVFTGYTITSAYLSEGSCVTQTIVKKLDTAYTQVLSEANGQVKLDVAGQKSFIDFLEFSSCSNQGANISPTALLQVSNTTSTSTTTFSGPIAQQSLSIASTIPASASASPTKNVTFPSVSVPQIVIGNKTITPTANPIGLPVFNGTTFSSLSGYPGPTGTISAFVSGGPSRDSLPLGWLAAWVVGLVGFGAGVYYM